MRKRIVAIVLLTICCMVGVLGFFELFDPQVSPQTPIDNTIRLLPLPAVELPNSTGALINVAISNIPLNSVQDENKSRVEIVSIGPLN